MAHWALSRALQAGGDAPGALAAAAEAEKRAVAVDDRERRLITTWHRFLKAKPLVDPERKRDLDAVHVELAHALSMYFEDPEVWLQKAACYENPLRAAPYVLAALRLDPKHPYGQVWKVTPPPAPHVTPTPTQPLGAVKDPIPLFPGLGELSHPITTRSPEALKYYEQGLRCWHAYVTPRRTKNGAFLNFQHAAALDPDCAMAYWGLSLCAGPGDPISSIGAANRALELALKSGSDKERRFAAARVLELSGDDRREEFLDAIDAAIVAYPDDVELWAWRGKVHGTGVECIPYQIAAYKIQPTHPSPNHELVHAYEGVDRPALGWRHTLGFRESAPNMPHANHMQAHLAMRLGRWQEAIDCTRTSREKSLAGFPELDPSHHIDTLIRSLGHEGRFREAESEPRAYRDGLPWARLLQLKASPAELDEWAKRRRTSNSPDGHYLGAIVELDRGNLQAARPFVDHTEAEWKKNPRIIYRYNEVMGRYLVQSGQVEPGLKLLREAAARAVKDTSLHAWGGGSYLLEVWGETALRAGKLDEAEEAYHEALAHEHGSVLGALGMQVVWERRGNPDLVRHYAARAAAAWKDSDPGALQRQLDRVRSLGAVKAPLAAP